MAFNLPSPGSLFRVPPLFGRMLPSGGGHMANPAPAPMQSVIKGPPPATGARGFLTRMGDRLARGLYQLDDGERVTSQMRRRAVADVLASIGQGRTIAEGIAQAPAFAQAGQDRRDARRREQDLEETVRGLNLTPWERAVFLANPERWAAENATRLGTYTGDPGSRIHFGQPGTTGASVTTVPRTGVDDGRAWRLDDEGFREVGSLGPSHRDETERLDAEVRRLREQIRERAARRAGVR